MGTPRDGPEPDSHISSPVVTRRMAVLSVNVNKVATVRNSRGGRIPSVLDFGFQAAAASVVPHTEASTMLTATG